MMKRSMIVNPTWNFLYTFGAGFLFNVPVMISMTIVWEKYSVNSMSYNSSFIPLISLVLVVMVLFFVVMVFLVLETIQKGCLTWYRDAVGHFVQLFIALSCILSSVINLRLYIEDYELEPLKTARTQSMMRCLMPMLVLSCLVALKLLFFKSKNTWIIALMVMSVAATAFTFESYFDTETYTVPLFIAALPVSLLLLSFTFLSVS
jgi:hypothetical protein